ncbi:PmoA family protein [Streptomyces capparidis]
MTLRVTHVIGERISVEDEDSGVELLAYVYRPEAAWEAPKPYAHPIRTRAGHIVTGYRPNDHRWHKGLQMTASHLSGQNLWGGNTYVPGQDYQALPDRVGSMTHEGFEEITTTADGGAVIAERLIWRPHSGEQWATEYRRVEVRDLAEDSWALVWSSSVTNRRDEPLRFGSPTTAGREMAGYTGLFWRGPRSFQGGRAFGPDLEGPELMGARSPWLAYTGEHDEVDGHATLVFEHAPENDHTGKCGGHPAHWFVRTTPTASVAPSLAFFDELELAPGATLDRRYRIVVADGAWDRARITAHLEEHTW